MRTLALLVILALASTGCVANMADLKDKLDAASTEEADLLVESAGVFANATNVTPPVARITIFGASNALLYQAGFAAADETALLFVPAGVDLTFLAGESEALEAGATLAAYAWTLDGVTYNGTRATAKLETPGLYPLVLTVTDSNGQSDTQTVPLALAPEPFEVVTEMKTGEVVGAAGTGQAARLAFSLTTAAAGVPATITDVRVLARPAAGCDVALALLDGDGNEVKRVDARDLSATDGTETIAPGPLPEGGYAIEVAPTTCIETAGVPVQVIVTYLEIVPGVTDAGGDGHGGHAH